MPPVTTHGDSEPSADEEYAAVDYARSPVRHPLDTVITDGTTGVLRRTGPGEGQSVCGAITAEIVLDQAGHTRFPIADDEIIDRAVTIQAIANREVRLLTCDTSQATCGRIAGLKVTKLAHTAGTGEEPPRERGGNQPRGNGIRAQRKNRSETEAAVASGA
jgi:hypothetical protein